MKSSFKQVLTYCILLSGLVFAGWYLNFNQKVPDNNTSTPDNNPTTDAKDNTPSRDQLTAMVARINGDVSALGKSSDDHREAMMADKLNALNREVGSLRDKLNALLLNNETFSPESAAVANTEHLSEEEQEQQARAQIEQQLAMYDRVAKQEGIDQNWASDAQAKVHQSFQNLAEDGIGVSEVKCHSSLCKARFFFDTADADSAIQNLQGVSPWQGETFIWIADTERGEGVIYLARDGDSLPDPDR